MTDRRPTRAEQSETRLLRQAGIPLSRAVVRARAHRRKPAVVLWATVVFAVGYVGLGAGWALWSLDLEEPRLARQVAPVVPTPAPTTLPSETATRLAGAEAAARAAQAKLQAAETRLARVEQQLASRAASPERPSPTVEADCVADLRRMAQGVQLSFALGAVTPRRDAALQSAVQFARAASACDTATVIVEGHTDSTGDEATNLQISWERADNTIGFLADQGIDTARFSALGFGARVPLGEGDADPSDRDRRVEFRVLRAASD